MCTPWLTDGEVRGQFVGFGSLLSCRFSGLLVVVASACTHRAISVALDAFLLCAVAETDLRLVNE